MMECYQQYVNICKRCTHLGSSGSCTDCGKICRSKYLSNFSQTSCRCASTPVCCTYQAPETARPKDTQAKPPTQPSSHPSASTPAAYTQSRQPQPTEQKKPEKQSFWQWLLSLFGFGGSKDKSAEEKAAKEKYDKGTPPAQQPRRPSYSHQAILAEARDICDEIRNRKAEPPQSVRAEQPSTPVKSPLDDEKEKEKAQSASSPDSKKKKKRKNKAKSPPRSQVREKYLGQPLESGQRRSSKSPSSPKGKSPVARSEAQAKERAQEAGEPPVCDDSQPLQRLSFTDRRRPPTSPIYSSERYLKPYTSKLCTQDPSCQICCACTPSTSESPDTSKKTDPSCSASCTMPSACRTYPPCCTKSCLSGRVCPGYCCDPFCCCRRVLCRSCSFCCCSTDLKIDMKKRRGNTSPCGGCSPRARDKSACQSKRKRSSSCPASPCCTPRPCPCPTPCCRVPPPCCPPSRCCPPPRCYPPPRTLLGAGCCPPRPCPPPCSSCNFRPAVSLKPRTTSPSCCPTPSCRGGSSPSCPITCMKPCCLPSVFSFPSKAPTGSAGLSCTYASCSASSYCKSKDNDALCKQLMAKYKITAPEPRAFCPKPRNLCPPCDFTPIMPKRTLREPAPGCSACGTGNCYNNNKPYYGGSNVLCDALENLTYVNKLTSANEPPVEEHQPGVSGAKASQPPTTGKRPKMEYHIPKRTPVVCVKQTGPRSPCKEYMTTYMFSKEPKSDAVVKDVKDVAAQMETGANAEEAKENAAKPTSKAKRQAPSSTRQSQKAETAEKSQRTKASDNISQNKTVGGDIGSETSVSPILHSWGISKSKTLRKNSRSKSTDMAKRAAAKPTHCRSPSKPVVENHPARRSGPLSPTRMFPQSSFLSLSPASRRSTPTRFSPVAARTGHRHSNTLFSKSLAEMPPSLHTTFSYKDVIPVSMSFYSPKFTTNRVTTSFSNYSGCRQPKSHPFVADLKLSPSPRQDMKSVSPFTCKEEGLGAKSVSPTQQQTGNTAEQSPLQVTGGSDDESESGMVLPKVESITTLVGKFDRIEVSATGVMAQSKCNIFDYISAENSSSSSIASTIREDNSSSITEEQSKESTCFEADINPYEGEEGENTSISDDLITDRGTGCAEMNKGASKFDLTHGDSKSQRKDANATCQDHGSASAVKMSDSIGDSFQQPLSNRNIESLVKKASLQDKPHILMIGESSVDPVEFGIIGESAVDPVGHKYKCEPVKGALREVNHSNNMPADYSDPKVDAVEPSDNGEGEAGAVGAVGHTKEEVDGLKSEEPKTGANAISSIEELLGNSGVKWNKVSEASEADIRLLRLSKAAHAQKALLTPTCTCDQGNPRASYSTPNNRTCDTDSKPFLSLLKPGELESSQICDHMDEAPVGSSVDQLRDFGTPV